MKNTLIVASIAVVGILSFNTTAFAQTTFYADVPASVSVGTEFGIQLKARLEEPINAVKTTVLLSPDTVQIVRFDDTDSVVKLWLQRGVTVPGGVKLEGVIPGGISPAFTDSVSLGTLWVRPTAEQPVKITYTDIEVYLHQENPTLGKVSAQSSTVAVHGPSDSVPQDVEPVVILDFDAKVVRNPALFNGARTLVFDIKTNRGTVDTVRVRERWFGLFGTWHDARSPYALSDSLGLSILDIALPVSMGSVHVVSLIPVQLKIVWAVIVLLLLGILYRYTKHRR